MQFVKVKRLVLCRFRYQYQIGFRGVPTSTQMGELRQPEPLFPILQQVRVGQVFRLLNFCGAQTDARSRHIEERSRKKVRIVCQFNICIGIDIQTVFSGLIDHARQVVFRAFNLQDVMEEHHALLGRVVPDVFLTALARVKPQQVGRYPAVWCHTVAFGIAPYQFVHELHRHRTAFAHCPIFVYVPDFDKITVVIRAVVVILFRIDNQRRPRMKQRPQFSCKFIRFYHNLSIYNVNKFIRPLEEPFRIVIHDKQAVGFR